MCECGEEDFYFDNTDLVDAGLVGLHIVDADIIAILSKSECDRLSSEHGEVKDVQASNGYHAYMPREEPVTIAVRAIAHLD